jgi:putative zinc finger protein
MCSKEQLVAYLYDDIGPADRGQVERHLRECAECRVELESLRGLRGTLAQWTPPMPDLGFRVVQDRRPSWRAWWTPALGLAAAAILVLAVASAVARVQVTRDANGWTLRTGWGAAPQASRAEVVPPPVGASAAVSSADFEKLRAAYVSLEQRLNTVESVAQKPSPTRNARLTGGPLSDPEIMRRVHDLLAQSESRQQRELAFRISQVIHDVDAQRVADMTRIQQGIGRIDAMTTQEAAAHRDLANYILTSSRQK